MKIDVAHVARLANLPLTPAEEKKYSEQLSKILDYIDQLERVDTSKVEPTYNVSANLNVMRPDEDSKCLTQREAIANAPKAKDGYIVTGKILREG